MTATLTLVPLDKIKPGDGFNPRNDFAEEQMAELVASVKRHGIISPLTLAPAEDGGYGLIACRRVVPALFSGIAWGGAQVFRTTVERLDALGVLGEQREVGPLPVPRRAQRERGSRPHVHPSSAPLRAGSTT